MQRCTPSSCEPSSRHFPTLKWLGLRRGSGWRLAVPEVDRGSRDRSPASLAALDGERKDSVAPPPVAEPGQPTRRAMGPPGRAAGCWRSAVSLAGAALSRRRAPHLNPQRVAVARVRRTIPDDRISTTSAA